MNRSGNIAARSQITSDILKLLQYSAYFEDSCKIILEKITNFSEVDVAFINIFDGDSGVQYEWNSNLTKLCTVETDISEFAHNYPNIIARMENFGTVYRDKLGATRGCEEEITRFGFPGMFMYAVRNDAVNRAYIGVLSLDPEKVWDNDVIALVCDMAQIISVLIYNKEVNDKLSQSNRLFKSVLDNIDSYVFVSDPATKEIIFANQKFDDNFGGATIGKAADAVVGIYSDNYDDDHTSANGAVTFDYYCKNTGQWFDISEVLIMWDVDKPMRLTTLNDISDKIEYEKVIEKQAFFDHLTELPNRRRLEKDFTELFEQSKNAHSDSHILYFDLDNFKNVNDSLGHHYGDELLIVIADYLRSLRTYGAIAYRFGGDEFLVILPHYAKIGIDRFIDMLLEQFRSEWTIHDNQYFCTISMGVVSFPKDGKSLNDLLKFADMAVYQVKKNGRDGCFKYNRQIGDSVSRRIELERCIHIDIAGGFKNFSVNYQPIINTITRELEGCEALLRWKTDAFGNIPPSEFIPMAEGLGYINRLGDFVIRQASEQLKKWCDMGKNLKMNINLSIGQLVEVDFMERLTQIINEVGAPFENIVLEVTESLAINDMKKMSELLRRINSLGIKIALDDFGTGYSSLNCLKEMPLNTIKIDKSFIDDIAENPSTVVFVKTIINLSHDLEMRVCAEGVEYKEQYEVLRSLDTDVIQGYLFGRPINAEEFESRCDFQTMMV
ncbi:MAG: bifunctional diguanylate cyclase/phosphodiesterase [Oscillospiraceae bacterium]